MKIAIVDDNAIDRDGILKNLTEYCDWNKLNLDADTYVSGESFIKHLAEKKYDVIFLDVFMQNLNGIEVAEKIRNSDKECLLVFITGSKDHAIESYRVRAFDYIVKPLERSKLYKTLDLICQALNNKGKFIEVKQGRTMTKIRVDDIIYTDYSNHYIYIHTDKNVIKTYNSFDVFSPSLLEFSQFLCCYRNCLINMDAVLEMEEKNFVMENGIRIPIAKVNRANIKSQFTDYVFHKMEK